MRLSGMAGFQHQGFVDPHFLACAFDWMLDDACHALDKGCPMAYFWFASSRSDLYSYWGPRLEDLLGQAITPASQQYRCLKAGLAPYPDDGISRVVIDTLTTGPTAGTATRACPASALPAPGRQQLRRTEAARRGRVQWRATPDAR